MGVSEKLWVSSLGVLTTRILLFRVLYNRSKIGALGSKFIADSIGAWTPRGRLGMQKYSKDAKYTKLVPTGWWSKVFQVVPTLSYLQS